MKNIHIRTLFLMAMILNGFQMVQADELFLDPADDEKMLRTMKRSGYWTAEQQTIRFRNMDKIFPTRKITASSSPYPLTYKKADLNNVMIRQGGIEMTVDEYFRKENVAGLLVIQNDKIVYERYGLGNTENSKWVSWSVTKSVVSMLIGAAIQDGYIDSVDEKITAYIPRLKGSSYDQATIRNVLQMSSGVRWNEDYADSKADVNRAQWNTLGLYEYLRDLPRDAKPGGVFNYNSAETNLVGSLLRSAIGNNLSTYLTEKIWKPFGMESEATWMLTEPGGGEFGGCCISATLRDYGRIGLFALERGRIANGTSTLPEGWMAESTTPSKGYFGYGYLWWLTGKGEFKAQGIHGQGIYINRNDNIVIALQSARAIASKGSEWALQGALFTAITKTLSE